MNSISSEQTKADDFSSSRTDWRGSLEKIGPVIALLAMVIGCLARRNAAIGVGGVAAFGLFGAFVAITRPESQPTDVVPSVIGGLAGIVAFAWLAWAASPVAPTAAAIRHARAGGHRRAW